MNDLRQAAIAGKFADEIDDLQTEVVALCEAHPGPRARQALAQAIHNEAVDMTGLAYQAMYQRIEPDPAAVARLLSLCDRAIELRQGLGPSAERLRVDVDQTMREAEQAYPTVVAGVRWPSRFRGPS